MLQRSMPDTARPPQQPGPFHLTSGPLSDLITHQDAWQALADNAARSNYFYAPCYALPMARYLAGHRPVEAAMIWREWPENQLQLVGLFPFICQSVNNGLPIRVLHGWQTPHSVSTTPLIRAGLVLEILQLFLNWLADGADGRTPQAVYWPDFDDTPEISEPLAHLLRHNDLIAKPVRRYQRPVLTAATDEDQNNPLKFVSSRKKSNLRRRWRGLEKLGTPEYHHVTDAPAVRKAVAAFLELEQAGWKGKRGTTLAMHENSLNFARAALTCRQGAHQSWADTLTLDDKIIAVSIGLKSPDLAWGIKTAYNEDYASYAPGLQLYWQMTQRFLQENWADSLDASCQPGHVIEDFWPARLTMNDLVFPARKDSQMASDLFAASLRGKNRLKQWVKSRLVTARTMMKRLKRTLKAKRS